MFRPERFTDLGEGDSPRRRDMERCVEFAFGSGQWQCVGRRIAFMKLSKTVFEVGSLISLTDPATTLQGKVWVFPNLGHAVRTLVYRSGLTHLFLKRYSGISTSSWSVL